MVQKLHRDLASVTAHSRAEYVGWFVTTFANHFVVKSEM